MTTYTITITADDGSTATTRLRLDTSGDRVILTDLHLHDGNGLSAGQPPAIDYGLLLAAITTNTPTPVSGPTPPVPGHDAMPAAVAGSATASARRRVRAAAPATTTNARRGGRGAVRDAAAATTRQPVSGGRRRGGGGDKAVAAAAGTAVAPARRTTTKAKTTKPTKTTGMTSDGTARAYRRMPDDFAAVYQQAGSASAVAAHYEVPRHTANGWIRRLREQGAIPAGR